MLPSCSSYRGGKGADARHVAGAPQSPGFAGCLGMGLHTNFPAKYRRTSARRCRWRLKCTSAPGGVCGHRVCISCRLSGRRRRAQGCERHVPAWDGCDTHEPLRWPGNGLRGGGDGAAERRGIGSTSLGRRRRRREGCGVSHPPSTGTVLGPVPAVGTEGLGGNGLTKMTTGVGGLQQGGDGDTGWAWRSQRPGSFSASFSRVPL